MISATTPLILASSSTYRAGLLARLRIPFQAIPADVDETPRPDEPPQALAERLALAKATALAATHPGRWILGSDQVCACAGQTLGKPGTRAAAIAQLTAQSGRSVEFFTAVALVRGAQPAADAHHQACDRTVVRFRGLATDEIERYVDAEPPLDCAGSFKCEGYGITLFEAIETTDPTALVGLPLIAVRRLLAQAGAALP